MTHQKFTLEVEALPPAGDEPAPLLPRAFILFTPGEGDARVDLPNKGHFVRVIIGESGFFILENGTVVPDRKAAPIHLTPFGQWRGGPGWRVRVTAASDPLRDMSIVDATSWGAPEIRIGQSDSEGLLVWRSESLPVAKGEERLVGRSRSRANIYVGDDLVSAVHLKIRCEADGYWAEDMRTPNGTLLDGKPLVGRMMLRHGSQLKIGNSILEFTNMLQLLRQGAAVPREIQASIVELKQPSPAPPAHAPEPPAAIPQQRPIPAEVSAPIPAPAARIEPTHRPRSSPSRWRIWLTILLLIAMLAGLVVFVAVLIHNRNQSNRKPASSAALQGWRFPVPSNSLI